MATKQNKEDGQPVKNKSKKSGAKHTIIGVSLLFGVLSIGYSSTFIIMGTDGWIPVVMVAPQIILGGLIAVWKFCK